jgi:hypothetical protein
MWRKLLCATFVLSVSFGLAFAEEFKGRITKVDGDTIYFKVGKDAPEPTKFEASKDVKVYVSKKGQKDEVKEGLTADVIKKIDPEKGRNATIKTDDEKKVIEIILGGGKKGN